jgi:hypothetical protein
MYKKPTTLVGKPLSDVGGVVPDRSRIRFTPRTAPPTDQNPGGDTPLSAEDVVAKSRALVKEVQERRQINQINDELDGLSEFVLYRVVPVIEEFNGKSMTLVEMERELLKLKPVIEELKPVIEEFNGKSMTLVEMERELLKLKRIMATDEFVPPPPPDTVPPQGRPGGTPRSRPSPGDSNKALDFGGGGILKKSNRKRKSKKSKRKRKSKKKSKHRKSRQSR